jgi:hypothetical protein
LGLFEHPMIMIYSPRMDENYKSYRIVRSVGCPHPNVAPVSSSGQRKEWKMKERKRSSWDGWHTCTQKKRENWNWNWNWNWNCVLRWMGDCLNI